MKCRFETCEGDAMSLGLCSGHYQQKRRGKELSPLKVYTRRDSQGKVCTRCSEYKTYDEFYKTVRGTYFSECKGCYSLRQKAKYAARRGQEGA